MDRVQEQRRPRFQKRGIVPEVISPGNPPETAAHLRGLPDADGRIRRVRRDLDDVDQADVDRADRVRVVVQDADAPWGWEVPDIDVQKQLLAQFAGGRPPEDGLI